jgi:tyrosyl-tRNA synthetase
MPRNDLGLQNRKAFLASMHLQVKRLWVNVERTLYNKYGMQNDWSRRRGIYTNGTWLHKTSIMEFMRLLGSKMRVGTLLAKET